jgi:LemA protein
MRLPSSPVIACIGSQPSVSKSGEAENFMRKLLVTLIAVVASANLSGCGYNKLQNQDESVKAAWSEVVNQYQRRSDLIPNLVATVKGFAAQEERVLVGVTEARARATSIQLTPELINNPEAFAKFQAAQGELTQALKSLLVTVERYPDLKSDANFRDLQVQLEGTENRITVARNRYIEAVKNFNVTVREFPTNLTAKWFDFEVKPNFTVQNETAISTAPGVTFDSSTPSQRSTPVEAAPTSSPPAPPPAN